MAAQAGDVMPKIEGSTGKVIEAVEEISSALREQSSVKQPDRES
jgi:methyl-accepting chemotaxis protein